jgi:hypothetical protein
MKARAGEGESLKPPVQQKQKDLKTQRICQDKQNVGSTPGQIAEGPRRSFISNEGSWLEAFRLW